MQHRIVAISGSLRTGSSNTVLLRAAALIAPSGMSVELYNPDLDGDEVPPAVESFRAELRTAHGLLISSPEYAHGVPGVMKNALDWLVGSTQGEIVDKPVALVNASPIATHAQASLVETLRMMSARVVADVRLTTSLKSKAYDETSLRSEPDVVRALSAAFAALESAINPGRGTQTA
jgi:chromate reductase, NAD(P)H dehydrogenase (quinone)